MKTAQGKSHRKEIHRRDADRTAREKTQLEKDEFMKDEETGIFLSKYDGQCQKWYPSLKVN